MGKVVGQDNLKLKRLNIWILPQIYTWPTHHFIFREHRLFWFSQIIWASEDFFFLPLQTYILTPTSSGTCSSCDHSEIWHCMRQPWLQHSSSCTKTGSDGGTGTYAQNNSLAYRHENGRLSFFNSVLNCCIDPQCHPRHLQLQLSQSSFLKL